MNDTKIYIIFMLGFVIALYSAYLPWFHPRKWKELILKDRQLLKNKAPFLPQNLSFKYFNLHPNLDLWWARLAPLFVALLLIFGMIMMKIRHH